jgi:hypothetical protein
MTSNTSSDNTQSANGLRRLQQADQQRVTGTLVDLFSLSILLMWCALLLNLENLGSPVEVTPILLACLLPVAINHSPFKDYAADSTILLQAALQGLVLLVVSESDWLLVAPFGVLVWGHIFLLRVGSTIIGTWAGIVGIAWLPLSRLLNTSTDFSSVVLVPMALYAGMGFVYWILLQEPEPVSDKAAIKPSNGHTTPASNRPWNEEFVQTVHQLANASGTIHSIATQQTMRAESQLKTVGETSDRLDEIRELGEGINGDIEYLIDLSNRSLTVAASGEETIESATEGMNNAHQTVQVVGRSIAQLANHLRRIGEIISSVSDIATQSNFLALNAQIEAARAHEQGLGFAVVADEVRDLAEQSSQAAADVRRILKEIQKSVLSAVNATEAGTQDVEQSLLKARESGDMIAQLYQTISSSDQAVRNILPRLNQQQENVANLIKTLQNLDTAAMQNQASTRMAENVSLDLTLLSGQLRATVAPIEEAKIPDEKAATSESLSTLEE